MDDDNEETLETDADVHLDNLEEPVGDKWPTLGLVVEDVVVPSAPLVIEEKDVTTKVPRCKEDYGHRSHAKFSKKVKNY